jgi:hypothetical protein
MVTPEVMQQLTSSPRPTDTGICFEHDQFVSWVDLEIGPGKLDSMDSCIVSGIGCSAERVLKNVCIPAPRTRAWIAGVFSCMVTACVSQT